MSMRHVSKGVGKEGAEVPQDFKLMLLCAKAVTAKERPKFRKQDRKKQLSGYKHAVLHI